MSSILVEKATMKIFQPHKKVEDLYTATGFILLCNPAFDESLTHCYVAVK